MATMTIGCSELETRSFLWIFHMNVGTEETVLSSTALTGHQQGTELDVEQLGLQPAAALQAENLCDMPWSKPL